MSDLTRPTFHPDPPAPIQRGLSPRDQDTIALLAMSGVSESLLERVADSMRQGRISR